MREMINEMAEKFKGMLTNFFRSGQTDIGHAEKYISQEISGMVLDILAAYYEQEDIRLLSDKSRRKEAGLQVERRNEKRQILTLLGELEYRRTYYRRREGGYCHPTDELAGVEANQKVSGGVSLALVEAAVKMSYAKSSQSVTGGHVSRQTVLHKVRSSRPEPVPVQERRTVPVLHVDADEDHVHLQNGKSTTVPLISVYEGVEHRGKRGICKNIVHYGGYGKKTEGFWEEVLNDLERRYDLDDTKIYLHGDGAAWIRKGLEWLPNSVFVLDRYHKNKALKHLVSGIDRASGCQYEQLARKALDSGDGPALDSICSRMLQRYSSRSKTIAEARDYLLNNLEGISIIQTDEEASRGGATEPHISHILSARLSSRPMGWSVETLKRLVPLLAAGADRVTLDDDGGAPVQPAAASSDWQRVKKAKVIPFSLGLPHPDLAVSLPAKYGKVTPLFNALRPF